MSLPRIVDRDEWLAARVELLEEEKALTAAGTRSTRVAASSRWSRSTRRTSCADRRERSGSSTSSTVGASSSCTTSCSIRRGTTAARAAPRGPTSSAPGSSSTCTCGTRATRWCRRHRWRSSNAGRRHAGGTSRGTRRSGPTSSTSASLDDDRCRVQLRTLPVEDFVDHPAAVRDAGAQLLPCTPTGACSTPTRSTRVALEMTGGSYFFLDLTALGRQEEWEEPTGRSESARVAQPDFST